MPTTSSTKETTAFDVSKYVINANISTKTVIIAETGDKFEVTVKPLSWSKKNQLLSKHLGWDDDGNTSFKADEYVRECLREMIVDAPWGKTTESFLISIDNRLGAALEKLVPQAFGDGEEAVDEVKKE